MIPTSYKRVDRRFFDSLVANRLALLVDTMKSFLNSYGTQLRLSLSTRVMTLRLI